LLGGRPRVLSASEAQQVYDAAVAVFRSATATIDGPADVMQALSDFGCDIQARSVRFGTGVVDTVLGRIAEVKARNDRGAPPQTMTSASGTPGVDTPASATSADTKLEPQASGQGLIWHDPFTDEIRPAVKDDLIAFSHMCDALDVGRAHPTILPNDVPPAVRDVWTFGLIALHSRRPWRVSVYSKSAVKYFVEIASIALGGIEHVEQEQVFAAKVWINSPFMISRDTIEYAMEARQLLGWPLEFASMPVMGSSAPVTITGCVAQSLAESFVANALSLAIDGRIVGLTSSPLAFDMKFGVQNESGPDAMLARIAMIDAAEHTFGGSIPCPAIPSTMAKKPGAQSVFEKFMGLFIGVMGGARCFGAMGRLAAGDVGSPVQLLIDLEMVRALQRFLDGAEVDEDRLAVSLILDMIPQGARYLEAEHTAAFHQAELWQHKLLDRQLPFAWLANPRTLVGNAKNQACALLATSPNHCPLTEVQRRHIEQLMGEATREIAGQQ
jgi:trimethylamine--corrinoid protein Co-methyltransferase